MEFKAGNCGGKLLSLAFESNRIRYNREFRNTHGQALSGHWLPDGTASDGRLGCTNRTARVDDDSHTSYPSKKEGKHGCQILQPFMHEKFWIRVAIPRWKRKFFWPTVRWAAPLSPAGLPLASTKPLNCATATIAAYLGKGVLKAVENVNGEIAEALANWDGFDQRSLRRKDDRARRHGKQGTPWSATRSWQFRWRPRALRRRASIFPLYRYLGGAGAHAADADDEHPERRRARRQ